MVLTQQQCDYALDRVQRAVSAKFQRLTDLNTVLGGCFSDEQMLEAIRRGRAKLRDGVAVTTSLRKAFDFSKTEVVLRSDKVRNAEKAIDAAADEVRDEIMLGDPCKALEMLHDFCREERYLKGICKEKQG